MSGCRQSLPGEEVSTELPENHRKLLEASCCLSLIQVQYSPQHSQIHLCYFFHYEKHQWTLSHLQHQQHINTVDALLEHKLVATHSYNSCSSILHTYQLFSVLDWQILAYPTDFTSKQFPAFNVFFSSLSKYKYCNLVFNFGKTKP